MSVQLWGKRERDVQHFVGVDLGQRECFTAVAVVERSQERELAKDWITYEELWIPDPPKFAVRHLERIRLGTSYVEVVQRIRSLMLRDELRGRSRLVVDATGVGGPVVDLFRKEGLPCDLMPVLSTSGREESSGKGVWSAPRQDLVQGLRVMLEQGKLEISSRLPEAQRLVEELVSFDRGQGTHDDLVSALAMATWAARREKEVEPRKTSQQLQAEADIGAMIYGLTTRSRR